MDTCNEFRRKVDDFLPGERCKKEFSFGFIGKRNKKIWIVTDDQLPEVYAAALNGQTLWIDPNDTGISLDAEPQGPQTRKCKENLILWNVVYCMKYALISMSISVNFDI